MLSLVGASSAFTQLCHPLFCPAFNHFTHFAAAAGGYRMLSLVDASSAFTQCVTPPLCHPAAAAGGYRMLSLVDATGRRTAACALRNCMYLFPLGALATWLGVTSPFFAYESGAEVSGCQGESVEWRAVGGGRASGAGSSLYSLLCAAAAAIASGATAAQRRSLPISCPATCPDCT